MNISVFGMGLVGLSTGISFAEVGNNVCCVDKSPQKIRLLKDGIATVYEPQLEGLLKTNLLAKRVSFTQDIQAAVNFAKLLFITVGTTFEESGQITTNEVDQVVKDIAEYIYEDKILVCKSTVPVGTSQALEAKINNFLRLRNCSAKVVVLSNPEFLKSGTAIADSLKPERVIVGSRSPESTKVMRQLYKPALQKDSSFLEMSTQSAELTKLAANAFLATKVAFINEFSRVCEKVGADVEDLRRALGSDSRIGAQHLSPSLGYSGSCLPKDLSALLNLSQSVSQDMPIVKGVKESNEQQLKYFFNKLLKHFKNDLTTKQITVWGLTFKPDTSDTRNSPVKTFLKYLVENEARVKVYDPVVTKLSDIDTYGANIELCTEAYRSLEGSDALCLCTDWRHFKELNFNKIKQGLKAPVIFDGRNLWSPRRLLAEGFTYYSIGRDSLCDENEL